MYRIIPHRQKHGKTDFAETHRILTNGHGVRHPVRKRWWRCGLVLTGFTGLTGLRVAAEGTRKARKSRGERGGERKTPIVGKATLSLRRTMVQHSARVAHYLCGALCSLWLISPVLPNSDTPRSGSNQTTPKAARQDAAPAAKTQLSAPYSDKRPWCQTPGARGGGTGWFLTGFTGLTGFGEVVSGSFVTDGLRFQGRHSRCPQ